MKDYLSISSSWLGVIIGALTPVVIALTVMHSDIEKLKGTKADQTDLAEVRVRFTEQLAMNTEAIKTLNETLTEISRRQYEQQKLSDRGPIRGSSQSDH